MCLQLLFPSTVTVHVQQRHRKRPSSSPSPNECASKRVRAAVSSGRSPLVPVFLPENVGHTNSPSE